MRVRAKMKELASRFPEGVHYDIAYDTTPFIRESIDDVRFTFFEAVCAGRPGRAGFFAELAIGDHSADRRAGGDH